jgi:RNA polymerase sigma-70 factor (ECF subfamily)
MRRPPWLPDYNEKVDQDDARLARDLLAGSPEAFDRFVARFRPRIFQYLWLMCGDREDAEEVAQETLLRVFESLDQLRDPERVRAWVFRIAKNACLMKRRKSVFAPAHELPLDAVQPAAEEDRAPLPDRQLLASEMSAALHRAISELPEIYKAVIILRDIEELSTEETAQLLEVQTDVVKTRLHRGRMALRQKMEEYANATA